MLIREGKTGRLEDALPALREAAATEAGEIGVMAVVTAAFVHYPQPQRSPEEWAMFWSGYVGACGHLSRDALLNGMAAWLAHPESQFLPKPGELRQFANQTPTEAHQLLARARAVIEAVRAEQASRHIAADHIKRGTTRQEQIAAVAGMFAEVSKQMLAAGAQQRQGMIRKAIPHANRCVRPQGELNATQSDILKRCGVEG